jgi:hypothetical protein
MKLDDEEIEKILGGAVRRVSNKYNAEAARLYILTLFAKIVGIRPLEGDKKEVA